MTLYLFQQQKENMENLTNLEKQVIKSIQSNGDEYNDLITDCIDNIRDNTNLSTKILRGVLASLVSKELIISTELPNGIIGFQLIN